ncbi:MAG: pyrroloquinoline quinone biosynthesis peptide chaperone PqqD [Gammaproteobacteria bacterium]
MLVPMFRFQWEPAQECHVLLYPEGMVRLSGSAGEILKRVDGKRSVADIVDDLKSAFPGVDLEQDVIIFLGQARDNGWVRA